MRHDNLSDTGKPTARMKIVEPFPSDRDALTEISQSVPFSVSKKKERRRP